MKYQTKIYWLFISGVLLTFYGCASVKTIDTVELPMKSVPTSVAKKKGVQHIVQKGETLWRIAKTYNVDLETLLADNNISDNTNIEVGQSIFIPGADYVQTVIVDTQDTPDAKDVNPSSFIWPAKGEIVGKYRVNSNGIEIKVPAGTKIKASRAGKVVFADYLPGSENTVIIEHNDGYLTVYSKTASVLANVNTNVAKGQEIAIAGNNNGTGLFSFQVRHGGKEKNPLYFLP